LSHCIILLNYSFPIFKFVFYFVIVWQRHLFLDLSLLIYLFPSNFHACSLPCCESSIKSLI
jgi:hypothetical protein